MLIVRECNHNYIKKPLYRSSHLIYLSPSPPSSHHSLIIVELLGPATHMKQSRALVQYLVLSLFLLGFVCGFKSRKHLSTMPPRIESAVSLSSSVASSENGCKLAFIGCGTIAQAIVTGIATQSSVPIKSISVSRRSKAKSDALTKQFPELVTVHDDNQELLDQSDIVFLTVLPEQTKEVLENLNFDPERHTLVSLVSTSNLPQLAEFSKLPVSSVFKMICLPAVSTHDGVCLLAPAKNQNAVLYSLLESLGGVVAAETEEEMSIMMVPSALMGPFYGLLKNNQEWLVKKGVAPEKASFLIGRQYHAMMVDAQNRCTNPEAYDELIKEQTPGGLNEQALDNLTKLGAMESYNTVQDSLLDRVMGKSDGSLE